MALAWALPLCWLLGSLPFGRLFAIAALHRELSSGSGNPGALLFWLAGKRLWAIPVFILEAGKVAAAFALAAYAAALPADGIALCSAAALLGHTFSPFCRFRPCRSLAAHFGLWLAAAPLAAVVLGLIWLLIAHSSRKVVWADLLTLGAAPLTVYTLATLPMAATVFVMAGLGVALQQQTLQRQRRGKFIQWHW